MNEAVVTKKLLDLDNAITKPLCPSSQKANSDGLYLAHGLKEGAGPSPDELLEQITLHVKYLLFDLEATRRENRYLRQMLESRPSPGSEDVGNDEGMDKF
jgi:hypothetical protein